MPININKWKNQLMGASFPLSPRREGGDEVQTQPLLPAMHAIGLQWPGTPRVDAAHAVVLRIDEEIGELRLLQLLRMPLFLLRPLVKLVDVVMQGRGIKWLISLYAESETACVGLLPPAHVALGARILRTDVGEKLLVGRLTVDAYGHALLAVGIVFDGAAAEVAAVLHVVGQLHDEPVAEEVGRFGRCVGRYVHGDEHLAHGADGVAQGEPGLYLRQVVDGCDECHVFPALVAHGRESRQLHLRMVPDSEFLVHICPHVVVGHGAPEVGSQRSALPEEALSAYCVFGEKPGLPVKTDGHAVCSREHDVGPTFLVDNLDGPMARFCRRDGIAVIGHCKLPVGDGLTCLHEWFGLLETEPDVEKAVARQTVVYGQSVFVCPAGSDVEPVEGAALHGLALLCELPFEPHVVQVAEEELVANADFTLFEVDGFGPDILILVGQFVGVGIELPVGA